MMQTRTLGGVGLVALLLSACSDTGQARARVPLYLAGTDIEEAQGAGDVAITLERAALAFGPLYLCAGHQAGQYCERARLEWLESAVVDLLDPEPYHAGELVGVTGAVRSYMFDLGFASLLTLGQPLAMPATEDLGGVSLRVEGIARTESVDLPFTVALVVAQEVATELGVPVVRKQTTEVFAHEVGEDEPGLVIRFDPSSWLSGVDFSGFVEDAECAAAGTAVVCAQTVEQRCAPDGSVAQSRDCAETGEVCLRGQGCAERLWIEHGTPGASGIVSTVVAGTRPSFDFRGP
jgi:hypothetical protein